MLSNLLFPERYFLQAGYWLSENALLELLFENHFLLSF